MTHVVRAATFADLPALLRMATTTGGGFTNLPPDHDALRAKLARAATSFTREDDCQADDCYLFVLEDTASGAVCGTCQIFGQVGADLPFYSFRIGVLTQYSKELGRTCRNEILSLCNDLDGVTEVGGLFLDPSARSGGLGKLLARCRYLFIAMHRPRFATRTIAELRGKLDEAGSSPFWEGLAGRFFGMSFREADEFNAIHGNQFIADLMPRHPIYTALLPDRARAVIGAPHAGGRAAMRMLEAEGFIHDGYVDIFDGGPTMIAPTDRIVTVRHAQTACVAAIGASDRTGAAALVATGSLGAFRCCRASLLPGEQGLAIDAEAAAILGVAVGDRVTFVTD